MSKAYQVSTTEFSIALSKDNLHQYDIQKVNDNIYSLIHLGKQYTIEVLPHSDIKNKEINVLINGQAMNFDIQRPIDLLISEFGFKNENDNNQNQIDAPMPGLVLEICVHTGQEVNEGDSLVILEAMKMENIIKSHKTGTIKSILIQKNQSVQKNDTLIEFE